MPNTLQRFRLPAVLVMFLSLLLTPVAFASAHELGDGRPGKGPEWNIPVSAFEVISSSVSESGEGSISATVEKATPKLTEETGFEEGDEVIITYTSETIFYVDREEVERDSFETGEILFVLGEIDSEDMTIAARVIADQPAHPYWLFRVGEVVEVDTTANTILVKSLRPVEEGEEPVYVFIRYDDETTFDEEREVVDESAITIGDKIHVHGEANTESEEYFAEVDADHVLLWTELEPKRPLFHYGHHHAQ